MSGPKGFQPVTAKSAPGRVLWIQPAGLGLSPKFQLSAYNWARFDGPTTASSFQKP